MKKLIVSAMAVTALCSVVSAEQLQTYDSEAYNEQAPEDKGVYIGLGYSHLTLDGDWEIMSYKGEVEYYKGEIDYHSLLLEVGYKFNPYIAVEANYIISISESYKDGPGGELDESVFGLYVKPMYPIAPEMDIYAMFGYALTNIDDSQNINNIDEGSFSWGAGASYQVTEEFAISAEYLRFYDDILNNTDYMIDSINVGISYQF